MNDTPNTDCKPAPVTAETAEQFAHDYYHAPEDQVLTPLPEHLRWKGPGDPPPRWTAPDGTIVYRSYADYCDD